MRTLVCTVLVAVGHSSGEEQPQPKVGFPVAPDLRTLVDEAREYYKKLPLDQQQVVYIDAGHDGLIPAQIDHIRRIEYRWKGVLLQPTQIPSFGGSGSFRIRPMAPTGFEVKEMSPPVRYYRIGDSPVFRPGYYDPYYRTFFQWQDIELQRSELPADAERLGLILSGRQLGEISSVEAPLEYRTRVPAPRNVLLNTQGVARPDVPADHGGKTVSPVTAVAKGTKTSGYLDSPYRWLTLGLAVLAVAAWILFRLRNKDRTDTKPEE